MIPRPPRSTRTDTLFPYTTLFRSLALKQQIADAQEGRRFVLQGGDCAESFADCESTIISNRLKVLLQMSLVLVHGMRLPVLRVGRFAGQYAKPRSSEERGVGKECGSTCRSRCSPYH